MVSRFAMRKCDSAGRIVIPACYRKLLDLKEDDSVEILTEDNIIILKKYLPHCAFCDETEGTKSYRGLLICPTCRLDIIGLAQTLPDNLTEGK